MQHNGEEVLWQDPPLKRYGAGILYPPEITENFQLDSEKEGDSNMNPDIDLDDDKKVDEEQEKTQKKSGSRTVGADDSEDYDVTMSNAHKPAAMGISFMVSLEEMEGLDVVVSFATYLEQEYKVKEWMEEDRWKPKFWFRKPNTETEESNCIISFSNEELKDVNTPKRKDVKGYEGKLKIITVIRNYGSDNYLITVTMVNTQKLESTKSIDEQCFFQCGFSVVINSEVLAIKPYPEVYKNRKYNSEEEINRLLYREKKTYAVGHGCAAHWESEAVSGVNKVSTEVFPEYETPSISADLFDIKTGKSLKISMRKLAGLDPDDDGKSELDNLINSYKDWIESLKDLDNRKAPNGDPIPINGDQVDTARLMIDRCEACLQRIQAGIDFIFDDKNKIALTAFQNANYAMLLSQLRQSRETRNPVVERDGLISWDMPIANPDPSVSHEYKGYWRPFQIAFLLMTLKGIAEPDNDYERNMVDLIWFPTGGGKTEAYLGLTAFTIFFNRLADNNVGGADVIMRYTLRLLTAQQFQRAATLFCAMEYLRKNKLRNQLGDKEFRLGMWVGGDATPNKREQAKISLKALQRDPKAENPFVLLKCPWCNAKMGPKDDGDRFGLHVYGYHKVRNSNNKTTVVYRCEDAACEFGGGPLNRNNPPLPICVVDEDLIDFPPNLIIGTVDKFALLTWNPEIRRFFGINNEGEHEGLPPSLIIQDELHLISGPLGSMVGAYETVIEELCILDDGPKLIRPKIIASTATISHAKEQVKSLYARENMMLFPPSGLEAGDSFFSKESRDELNNLKPGRLYLGVMAPAHGSMQTTQARVYAMLLHSAKQIESGEISDNDPWWTLLIFFNSLRELGGANTLFSSDVRDYLKVISSRYSSKSFRFINTLIELTSRMRGDQIPEYIKLLEKTLRINKKGNFVDAVDVCLASSISEVGVDIDRLSLIAIVGQPKTTSQYIQVSSRVGRNLDAPGLVLTLFNQGKPRDRSHYETFRSYHQSLYAQVEPTSVTPFSPPAVDRALHGIIVAAVRQLSPILSVKTNARPFPLFHGSKLRKKIEQFIERRVSVVDASEKDYVKKIFLKRLKEWEVWNPSMYGGWTALEDAPLMHPAGSYKPESWNNLSWGAMSSMRSVDASCEAEVTSFYNEIIEDM